MIRYALQCGHNHTFEGWFSHSSDFDAQCDKGLLQCPECGTHNVTKAIMAPNISTGRKKEKIAQDHAQKNTDVQKIMNAAAEKIREKIARECDYVGEKFTEEARAMYYGEREERPIYGQATPKQASELIDEGIAVAPLPDPLAPRPKKAVN